MTWSARQLAGLCCRAGCPLSLYDLSIAELVNKVEILEGRIDGFVQRELDSDRLVDDLLTEFAFDNLTAIFAFIGRIHAIRCALHYDLSGLTWAEHRLEGAAAILWRSHMDSWNAAHR